MTHALVLGSLLGLFAGMVPGAFSAMVAATALQRGFREGARVATIPLLSEVVVLVLTTLILSQLPDAALRWMGMAGGGLIFYLAWRTFRESRTPPEPKAPDGSRKRVVQAVALALLSPAPWAFWLLVGSPLFLVSWRAGWEAGMVFLGSFLVLLLAVRLGIAATAAAGGRHLTERWYRRVTVGVGVALVVAGAVLVWQSWVGNFQRMISGSEAVSQEVQERMR